jgi:hypothetical protein
VYDRLVMRFHAPVCEFSGMRPDGYRETALPPGQL